MAIITQFTVDDDVGNDDDDEDDFAIGHIYVFMRCDYIFLMNFTPLYFVLCKNRCQFLLGHVTMRRPNHYLLSLAYQAWKIDFCLRLETLILANSRCTQHVSKYRL